MFYVYVALVCLGVNVSSFVAVILLMRWAIPRYGALAMSAAMRSRAGQSAPIVAPAIKKP